MRKRITIFVMHIDDNSDYNTVKSWLEKWGDEIHIEDYVSGGYEHSWDVEAPLKAIEELPENWLCMSKWSSPEIFNKNQKSK